MKNGIRAMKLKNAKSIFLSSIVTVCLTFGFTSAAQAVSDTTDQEGVSFISDQVPETAGMCSLPCGNNKQN
jgi:hypothetical protein